MNMQSDIASIGHNLPPLDLRERLAADHAQLRHEVETLAARANVAPKAIKAPADLDTIATLAKDARTLWGKVDAARVTAKAPFLQSERDVQAYFAVFLDRLTRMSTVFQAIGDQHQQAVARAARAKAQAEAEEARREEQRQRDAAAIAALESKPAAAIKLDAKADAASDRAYRAEAVATVKAADLTRARTSSGVLASARTDWAFEVTDYDKIPLDSLRAYLKREAIDAAVRMAVKMGIRTMPGVRIYEDVKATFR